MSIRKRTQQVYLCLIRASSVEPEVRVAPHQVGAVTIADAMVEENITKGWNNVVG